MQNTLVLASPTVLQASPIPFPLRVSENLSRLVVVGKGCVVRLSCQKNFCLFWGSFCSAKHHFTKETKPLCQHPQNNQ